MTDPYNPITPDDVALANRTVLTRASVVARIAGIVVIVIGVVGFAAWLWLVVRTQQQLNQTRGVDQFGQPAPPAGFRDRIDQSVGTVEIMLWATLTIGGGFALRLLGQHSLARSGGSLTGYEVGDAVPEPVAETTGEADDDDGNTTDEGSPS